MTSLLILFGAPIFAFSLAKLVSFYLDMNSSWQMHLALKHKVLGDAVEFDPEEGEEGDDLLKDSGDFTKEKFIINFMTMMGKVDPVIVEMLGEKYDLLLEGTDTAAA